MEYKTRYLAPVSVFVVGMMTAENVLCGLMDSQPLAGPTNVYVKKLENCPKRLRGEDVARLDNITSSFNQNRPFEFFWSGTAEIRLAQWTDQGRWKHGIKEFRIPRPCTAVTQYMGEIAESVMTEIYGKKVPCPTPRVKHDVRNMSVNTRTIRLNEFVYGKWRGDLIMLHGSARKGCLRIYTEISRPVTSKHDD